MRTVLQSVVSTGSKKQQHKVTVVRLPKMVSAVSAAKVSLVGFLFVSIDGSALDSDVVVDGSLTREIEHLVLSSASVDTIESYVVVNSGPETSASE